MRKKTILLVANILLIAILAFNFPTLSAEPSAVPADTQPEASPQAELPSRVRRLLSPHLLQKANLHLQQQYHPGQPLNRLLKGRQRPQS